MDEQERKNWETVKQALEKAGKQDTMYYKRATAICFWQKGPVRIVEGFTF